MDDNTTLSKSQNRICQNCKAEISNKNKKFCTSKCYHKHKCKQKQAHCDNCSKVIFITRWQEKEYMKHFCNRKCMFKHRSKENHHNWKGGHITIYGYRMLSENGKHIFEHRYIMEQFLGRKLKKNEIIHHINEDKLDNRIENLLITNREEHQIKYHRKEDKWKKWTFKFDQCVKCGTTENKHAGKGMCRICYHRKRRRDLCAGSQALEILK